MQRCRADQLLRAAAQHRPDCARPSTSGEQPSAHGDAAADEGADIDIDKAVIPSGIPGFQFGKASRRDVVQGCDGQCEALCDLGPQIGTVPVGHRARGGVGGVLPVRQLIRQRQSDPGQMRALRSTKTVHHRGVGVVDHAPDLGQFRKRIAVGDPFQNTVVEPHADDLERPAPDLDAKRSRAIGVQPVGCGGLPHTSAHCFAGLQQALTHQTVHDHRRRLCRQPRGTGQLGLAQRAGAAHQMQEQPVVAGQCCACNLCHRALLFHRVKQAQQNRASQYINQVELVIDTQADSALSQVSTGKGGQAGAGQTRDRHRR